MTGFIKCIENFDCFDPRKPPNFLLADPSGWIFRGMVNLINVTDKICTDETQLRAGNYDKFNVLFTLFFKFYN